VVLPLAGPLNSYHIPVQSILYHINCICAQPPEERASGIPRRSDSDRKEDPGSPIRSRTGSEKIPARDLRDAEDDMPVGNLLEHVAAEPFPEFRHQLLMAGGTEMTALAGEG